MSQTIGFIVTRAFSIAKIKKGNIDIEDEEMAIGIDTYNDIITQFNIDGISLGATIVNDKDDETDIPDWAQDMIKTQIAIRILDEFNRPLTVVMSERADRALRAVMRKVSEQRGSAFPNTLPIGTGNYRFRTNTFFPDRDCGDITGGNNDFMLDDEGQVIQDNTDCAGANISTIGDSNG